jgi:Domain of unknown function (DUF4224)
MISQEVNPMDKTIRLSSEELSELVGSSRKQKQIEWLGHRGWRFDLDVNGRPIVMKSYLESRLGVTSAKPEANQSRPRFELLATRYATT